MTALAAALLISAALVQPGAPPAERPAVVAGGVEGLVHSSEGGRPLPYARVQVVGNTMADWTDERGAYRLADLPGGEWRLRIAHPGHDAIELAIFVPGDRAVRLDVTLRARPGPTADPLADFQPFRGEFTLPALLNGHELSVLMRRLYPPELARRRIGGEAVLRLWLDEGGRVVKSRVSASSGQPALDSIALTVSDRMRFRPARSRNESVRVIVRMPVLFTVPEPVPDSSPDRW